MFLISLKAGGFGLNLTGPTTASYAIRGGTRPPRAQAVDRAHRIGQTRPVNVYRLVSAGTIEERVVALQDPNAPCSTRWWTTANCSAPRSAPTTSAR